MSTISIAKNGGMCEIVIDGSPQYFEVNPKDVQLGFNTGTNYINVCFPIQDYNMYSPKVGVLCTIGSLHGIFGQAIPMASVTIGGVVITSKSVFDTQIAAVFPNTNSGSGGSGSTTIAIETDDTAAFAALTDGKGAFFEVAGEVSYYAISSTGVNKKLTIPNF